jgi:riboflavin synthase
MFTGIVEELGTVEALERQSDAVRLTVRATTVLADAALGDSISVNGCCLTVASTGSTGSTDDGGSTDEGNSTDLFVADVMAETLDKTGLGALAPGDRVNLERAVTAGTRLGGHLVQGHVDAVGHVVRRDPGDHWDVVTISFPPDLAPYLVDKGSITVDGVSLTVVQAGGDTFTVSLIPETLRRTTLGFREPGDPVNLEVDVIGKYVARQLDAQLDARLALLRPSEGTRP